MDMTGRHERAGDRVDRHMVGREPKRTLRDHHRSIRLIDILFLKLIDPLGSDREGLICRRGRRDRRLRKGRSAGQKQAEQPIEKTRRCLKSDRLPQSQRRVAVWPHLSHE